MNDALLHCKQHGISFSMLRAGKVYAGWAAFQIIECVFFKEKIVQLFLLKKDGAAQAGWFSVCLFHGERSFLLF